MPTPKEDFDEEAAYAVEHFHEVLFNRSPRLISAIPDEYQQLEQKSRRFLTPKFSKDINEFATGPGVVATLYGPVQDLLAEVERNCPFDGLWRFFVEDCGLQVHREVFTAEFFLWVGGRYVQLEQEAQGNLVVCEPSANGYLLSDARRRITHHAVNGLNEQLDIEVLDAPGHGGACHEYQITPTGDAIKDCRPCFIHFQNGPIKEHGVNGVSNEALIAILIDRLEGFQSGQFACHDNQMALDHLQSARLWLHKRTLDRVACGVERRSKA